MSNWNRLFRGYPGRGTQRNPDQAPGCFVFPLPCGCGCCYGAVFVFLLALVLAITTLAR